MKKGRTMVNCICDYCEKDFIKPESEYKRNIILQKHNFCSRSCARTWGNQNCKRIVTQVLLDHLHKINDMKSKEFVPFTYTLRNAKRRFKDFDLDLQYLKDLWEEQQGICPYTKIKLELPTYKNTIHPTIRASLDRIDSSKGYVKGNVQFVSTSINYMKGELTDIETKLFLNTIVNNLLQ